MNCKSLVLSWDIEVCGNVSKYSMAFLCQGMTISVIKHVFPLLYARSVIIVSFTIVRNIVMKILRYITPDSVLQRKKASYYQKEVPL